MNSLNPFHALVAASAVADHAEMIDASFAFFEQMAQENYFSVRITRDADEIHPENLKNYQVFVMLHLAPFDMTLAQQTALQQFIEEGKGWVGIHGAGLTGKQFLGAGTPYWQWFEDFLGGVTYTTHPAYQTGTLRIEDGDHPVTRNLPPFFAMSDEWYEFNESPRGRVRVLACADESTYRQVQPMGDHPLVWINEQYRRAVYIGVGHDSTALANPAYAVLVRDAVLWAAS
jgi:type 1 glutamine amidotransferase